MEVFEMKKSGALLSTILAVIMLTVMLCPVLPVYGAGSSIIVDHNNATLADLESIPTEWINKAKSNLNIYYSHTSHGSQITTGMTGLVSFKGSTYAWNSTGKDGALRLREGGTDLGDSNWPQQTRNFLKNNPGVNVVMWSWCGQVSDASKDYIDKYLSAMNQLEKEYPNVKFVYMTGHTDGTGVNGNLNIRNEQIRSYCRTNNKILFDFADIESYDPDGKYYLDKKVNDNCDYDSDGNGSRESNWAIAWQNSHTKNVDWYDCSSAHSQPLNANMKAYAAWYLWARLAGWNGETSDDSGDKTPQSVEKTFNDIGKSYAKNQIETLASKGFYDWIEGSSFKPGRNITRGEFLYLLVKTFDLHGTAEDNFIDVKPTDFYYEAAAIAKKYGISNGIGKNKLGGELSITRQDMSVMVVRAWNATGRMFQAGSETDLAQFIDADKIAPYAKESMAILERNGILQGYNKTIDPRGNFTMEQAAMVIWRIDKGE